MKRPTLRRRANAEQRGALTERCAFCGHERAAHTLIVRNTAGGGLKPIRGKCRGTVDAGSRRDCGVRCRFFIGAQLGLFRPGERSDGTH
jgi:hypothetical protein